MDTLISIKNIDFNYNNSVILENISLDIKKGQNLAILGRNGGGKSTLVKLILGFLKPSSGSIEYIIDKNKLGYLPQIREFDTTFPINLFDLVISGLTNNKNFFSKFSSLDKEKTVNLMNEFEILELKDKHINEVSGGQLQRALIARAIISEPELIFLDEPESFLDKEFEEKLYTKIKSLKNSTLVVISHEIDKICEYIDAICVIEKDIVFYENKMDYPHTHTHGYEHTHGKD
jgi:zinc transport system ATP-binding protein